VTRTPGQRFRFVQLFHPANPIEADDVSFDVGDLLLGKGPAPFGFATEIPDPRSVNPVKIAIADTACFLVMMDPPFTGNDRDVRHKGRHRRAMKL
jgi:hypothetical protein